jgi:tripartite-type tricarboxylate transporter receptor subunit TctC
MTMRRFLLAATFAAAFATAVPVDAADADRYPAKPVTLVVGFAPGGSADILARLTAAKLTTLLGQQVIVENKPGAGGAIAAGIVAAAPADGYTLLLATSGHAGLGALYSHLPFDPVKAFAPVAKLGASPVVIVTSAAKPYRSLGDVLAAARKAPGKLNYAAGGGGATVTALAAEYLKSAAKVDMLNVPYKGSGPALTALMAGEVDLAFDIPSSALPLVKSGKLRALAVTSATRSSVLPDVATVAEQGVPGFEVLGWFGVMAPAATPPAVIARVNAAIDAMLREPDVKDKLVALGVEPGGGTPADFGRLLDADTRRAGEAIRRLGITAD